MSLSKKNFQDIVTNLNEVKMPSTLWAAHLHPENKFVGFIMLSDNYVESVNISRSVVLKNTEINIDVDIFINGTYLDGTLFTKKNIEGVQDVSELISKVHEAYICTRYNQNKHCLKIVDKKDTVCSNCLNEAVLTASQVNATKKAILEETTNNENELSTDTPKKFTCTHCPQSFPTRRLLNKHTRKHIKLYKCEACKRTFAHKRTYQVHFIKQHETVTRIYMCSLCGKGYRTVELLKLHELKHTNTQGNQNSLKLPHK